MLRLPPLVERPAEVGGRDEERHFAC
jgi:hypothetical protein